MYGCVAHFSQGFNKREHYYKISQYDDHILYTQYRHIYNMITRNRLIRKTTDIL